MQTTVTVHWNKGEIAKKHNERDKDLCEHEQHIDLYNKHGDSFHDVLYRKDITEAYTEIFGDAIEEYNAKQKRKDRLKTVESYMQEIESDMRGKRQTKRVNGKRVIDEDARRGKQLSYEITIKVGNTERERDASGATLYDATNHHIRPEELPRDLQRSILIEYCDTFQDANPNFRVINMDLHGDEGFYNAKGKWEYDVIHPHIEFIPISGGNVRQGLSVQNSMNKALDAMGYGGDTDAYDRWAKKEQARLEVIVQEQYKDYCIDHPDFYNDRGDLTIYHPVRDKQRAGDMDKEQFIKEQELQEQQAKLEQQQADIANTMRQTNIAIENFLADKKAFEEEKRLYEQNTALQQKSLQAKEEELTSKQQELDVAEKNCKKIRSIVDEYLCDASELIEDAEKLHDDAKNVAKNENAEWRMRSFMEKYTVDGKSLYAKFKEEEPQFEQKRITFERNLAELERKYNRIQKTHERSNPYDFSL